MGREARVAPAAQKRLKQGALALPSMTREARVPLFLFRGGRTRPLALPASPSFMPWIDPTEPKKLFNSAEADARLPGFEQVLFQLAVSLLLSLPATGHVETCVWPA